VSESDRSQSSLSDSVIRLAGRFLGSRSKESHFSAPAPLDQVQATHNEPLLGLRVHELIEAQVRVTPENVAVSFDNDYLTYQQLDQRANQLARYLRSMGVGPGTCVAVFLERGLAMVVALLATLKSGAAYLPMDPMFPQDRLAFMLNDAKVPVVLSQRSLSGNRSFGAARVVQLDRDADEIAAENTEKPEEITAPDDLAYVIFTSGSTGKPKGVEIEHRSVTNFLLSMRETPGLDSSDTLVAVTTISFDIAALEIFLPLCVGARVVIASREVAADGTQLLELLRACDATVMQATPVTWKLLLEAGWDGDPRLKVLCGGEAFSRKLANELVRCGSSVWNMYGPTETTIWSSCTRIQDSSGPVLIGPPISETQIYVLDEDLQPVSIGMTGELYIGGTGVARGYLNRPELTAQKFIPDPFSSEPGPRLYRTGDLGRGLPSGAIEYLGRMDFQVKIRGYRIELGELESLIREYPGIRDTVVVASEDRPGNKRLIAYVVAEDRKRFNATALRDSLRKRLPEYMLPASFISLAALPVTLNGKLDRKALPSAGKGSFEVLRKRIAPRNDTERRLVNIWQDVLGIPSISVDDNFFDIGGNSLLAVRLFNRMEKTFGIKLPLATLIEAQTVEQLAGILSENAGRSWSPLVEMQPKGARPPFFCVHGASGNVLIYRDLSRHLGPDQPFYGLQAQGLNGTAECLTTVEDMAALYINEIRRVQPEGPYFIGGYCLGGTIAYEIAQQLVSRGQTVGLLALFDTLNWSNMGTTSSWNAAYSQVQRLLFHAGNFLMLDWKNKSRFFWEKVEILRERSRVWRGIILGRLISERGSFDSKSMVDAQVWKTNDQAKMGYVPKPYPGVVTDFRPKKQYSIFNRTDMYWDQFALKGYEIVTLPVYPAGMLIEPFVEHLATALRAGIDKAIRGNLLR
jgi:amino acid adenylation domain-containing protein